MATHTYTLQAIKSAGIDEKNPNTNYSTASTWDIRNIEAAAGDFTYNWKGLLVGFESAAELPLMGKVITGITIYLYVNNDAEPGTIDVYSNSNFVENSVTQNTCQRGNYFTYKYIRSGSQTIPGYYAIPCVYGSALNLTTLSALVSGARFGAEVGFGTMYHEICINVDTTRGTNPPYIVVTAVDSTPTVTPTAPQNRYENSSGTLTMRWSYANAGGGNQKSYVLQYKDLGHTEWTELASATSAATEHEVEANFFSAGEVQWRVKAVSAYDIESEWSAAATFIAQGAPLAPAITVDISPRPKITWTGLGQQAYEVRKGNDNHKFFGTAQAYNVKEYLPDGDITVGVRVQNEFGLWSAWSLETITVANTPGDSITLTVQATDKARLAWTDTTHTAYYIYRDDVAIAKVTDTTFTDHVAIGRHTYKVRGVDGDNYSMSNEVTCTLRVDCPIIAALDALTWLKLKHTASQERAIGMSASQDVTFQYYAGRTLPLAESGGRVSKSHSFSVAFESPADAAAFEALLGKTVVYKDQHNRLFVGPLMAYESSTGIFFAEYSCTIMQTDNREAVDYD